MIQQQYIQLLQIYALDRRLFANAVEGLDTWLMHALNVDLI